MINDYARAANPNFANRIGRTAAGASDCLFGLS